MSTAFEFASTIHCGGLLAPPEGGGWFFVSSNSNTIEKSDGEIATFVTVVWARTRLPAEAQPDAPSV